MWTLFTASEYTVYKLTSSLLPENVTVTVCLGYWLQWVTSAKVCFISLWCMCTLFGLLSDFIHLNYTMVLEINCQIHRKFIDWLLIKLSQLISYSLFNQKQAFYEFLLSFMAGLRGKSIWRTWRQCKSQWWCHLTKYTKKAIYFQHGLCLWLEFVVWLLHELAQLVLHRYCCLGFGLQQKLLWLWA